MIPVVIVAAVVLAAIVGGLVLVDDLLHRDRGGDDW